MEFSLLFAVLIGVGALYGFLWWEAARGNAADCSRSLFDVALTAGAVGLLVGRLAAMIGDGVDPLANPADIVVVRAGVATGPAALAAIVTMAALSRTELVALADALAAAVLAGLGGWHAGCLARDACLGTSSDLPWAYALDGGTLTRHPVELYAALLFLAAGAAVAWAKAHRRLAPLVPAGIALAVAGAVRLATEPMRPSLAGGPEAWYWASVGSGVVIVGYAVVRRRSGKPGLVFPGPIRSR